MVFVKFFTTKHFTLNFTSFVTRMYKQSALEYLMVLQINYNSSIFYENKYGVLVTNEDEMSFTYQKPTS